MRHANQKIVVGGIFRRGLLYFLLSVGISTLLVPSAQSATVSGSIVIPDSDMGYKPNLLGMNSRVRVEGTDISANVIAANRDEGSFTLTNVPSGANTLLFVEGDTDIFTQSSKRVQVNVVGDLTGVTFTLAYHWKGLAGYPPNWGTTGYVNEWVPHFVSDQVGFILFRVRGAGIDPERVELYRTVNGGQTWDEIGHWVSGASVYPDNLDRYLYFSDQNHGVIQALVDVNSSPNVVWYHTQGVLYTSDGGATWNYSDFPNPPEATASGDIAIGRFAGISDTHWIACGSNGGTYTYGLPNYQVIWETTNSGQNWEIKMYWQEDGGGCTALGADPSGKAIAFFTPYAWGGDKKVVLRDSSGNWTRIDDNVLITNSGYGPADIPMIGDTAWVRNDDHSTLPPGLYRTGDAGLNWQKISDSLPQYMDFATEKKGFGPAGGPMYVTYDGGANWLYQSGGGGLCCHGNNVWAFDATHAVWHDIGVGDPNTAAALFTYVEPWEANFEIVPGVPIGNGFFMRGASNVPLASYKLFNHGPVPIRVNGLTLNASGTGNEGIGIQQVRLWQDRNANGYVDAGDIPLAQGIYPADNNSLPLPFTQSIVLEQFVPLYLLVTYDFTLNVTPPQTFSCTIRANQVVAERTDTDDPIFPNAPPSYPLPGGVATIVERIIDFNGNGKPDILWRNGATGANAVWFMNGATVAGAAFLVSMIDQTWKIVGTGDFNNDGNIDILWRNTANGLNAVWFLEGMTVKGITVLDSMPDQGWAIVGTGDFNNDGNIDILWRNTANGQNAVWFMNGPTVTGFAVLDSMPDQSWKIVGTGDFDEDGKVDILWRNTANGQNAVWFMNGAAVTGFAVLDSMPDQSWKIVGTGDFNNDLKSDILWRNTTNGMNAVWYMNGATVTSFAVLDSMPDQSWEIVGR